MQISPISSNQYNSPKFGKALYKEIRHLPNVQCACCGKKMISQTALGQSFESITRPLAKMIEKGFFAFWEKEPKIWKILTDFAEKYPKYSLDKILNEKENRTILKLALKDKAVEEKSKTILNVKNPKYLRLIDREILDNYDDIRNRSRSSLKGAGTVMKRMAVFKEYLSGEKLATFEQLEIYAQKYPRKTLSEILNMDEIYKFHKAKDVLQRAETNEKLEYHFKNIEKLIKKLDPNSDDMIYELKEEAKSHYELRDENRRIFQIKKIYKKALEKYNNKNIENKIMAQIEQFPKSFITKDSFLAYAKNHGYSDIRIIASLLLPSEVSFEHIVPQSEKGQDEASNGILLCRECNQNRSSIPYEEFIQYNPQMPYNVQKQINMIGNYILDGRLDDTYRFWPIKVSKTIAEYSNDAIKPDISEYAKKCLKKIDKIIEANSEEIKTIKSECDEKYKERTEIFRKLDELKKEIIQLKEDNSKLQEKNKLEECLKETLNEYLNKK